MNFEVKDKNSFIASQLLGDGHNVNDTSLVISHSDKQLDYLKWKREIAISLGLKCSKISCRFLNSTFGEQTLYTFCVSQLKEDLKTFKNSGITGLIENLNPLGLLLWWLDDGCMVVHEKKQGTSISRFGYLSTEGFSLEQNQEISRKLLKIFKLETKVHKTRGGFNKDVVYYRQYFNATNLRAMIDIVRPLLREMPSNMLYKLDMDYRPTRIKSSLEYSVLYNF